MRAMCKPLVIGNWKMNGSRCSIAQLLAGIEALGRHSEVEVAVCPPFVYLAEVAPRAAAAGLRLGAQHVSEYESGAYTGEISAAMLVDIGCDYVLIGHSERRALFGDSARVAGQLAAAQRAGLGPVLCVGEDAVQREAGETRSVLVGQLAAAGLVAGCEAERTAGLVIAYEPVWAIGTGHAADPAAVQQAHRWIREALGGFGERVPILYGGSVTAKNVAELMAQPDVDGALVGGASLRAGEFTAICALAAKA